jgi:hypothetical protein
MPGQLLPASPASHVPASQSRKAIKRRDMHADSETCRVPTARFTLAWPVCLVLPGVGRSAGCSLAALPSCFYRAQNSALIPRPARTSSRVNWQWLVGTDRTRASTPSLHITQVSIHTFGFWMGMGLRLASCSPRARPAFSLPT